MKGYNDLILATLKHKLVNQNIIYHEDEGSRILLPTRRQAVRHNADRIKTKELGSVREDLFIWYSVHNSW
jgi:hypothetical protein